MRLSPQKIIEAVRRWRAGSRHVRLDSSCVLESAARLRHGIRDSKPGYISVGAGSRLACGALVDAWGGSVTIGQNVFIGPYAVIYGQGGVEIGDDTLISMHCRILSSSHRVPSLERHIWWEGDDLLPTRIGRDVWLGAGVTVLGGVTIGDGSVIGAGAVVTGDIPPGVIAVGVPARVIGQRAAKA